MRNIIRLIICATAILSLVACIPVNIDDSTSQGELSTVLVRQDFPHYKSIDSLSEKADVVIKGRVIKSRVEALNDVIYSTSVDEKMNPEGELPEEKTNYTIYTIYTIEIVDSLKGNSKPGDTIEVKQLGGEVENIDFISEENIDILTGNDYVLFLATYENTPASLLNSVQSLYIYGETSEEGANTQKVEESNITSANPENDLVLRLHDLDVIKNKYILN